MSSRPVRLLLTKKMPPPPSRAWLFSTLVPKTRRVMSLPSLYMAPPLPPPGLPPLAPFPMASLWLNKLLMMVQETPIELMAPPLAHSFPKAGPPPKVLLTTYSTRP